MNNGSLIRGSACVVMFFSVGCGDPDPYSLGLKFTLKTDVEQIINSYRLVDGDEEPEPSIGLVGSASTCLLAGLSGGSRTVSAVKEEQSLNQVVGVTSLNHPLVPNSDEFSDLSAAIVQERTQELSYVVTDETLNELTPGGATEYITYRVLSYQDDVIKTASGYYGVAVDEYSVRFDVGQLWSDFEELSPDAVDLLTKDSPEIGDVWVSQNGNTVNIYKGVESITLGGVPRLAHKVELYETDSVQANGGAVYTQCLNFGLDQLNTDNLDITQYSNNQVFLNSGCEGTFTHSKVGTQWWYNHVLVKEEVTVTDIMINDYGFEWFEEDGVGGCNRISSQYKDDPYIAATQFVQYDLITSVRESEITAWSEVDGNAGLR